MELEIIDVLLKHYQGLEYRMKGNPANEAEFNTNFIVDKTNGVETPTWTKLQSLLAEMKTAYANNKYQRDRKAKYPDISDQLDMQYWDAVNGTTLWQDHIAKIKSDIPKE